MGFLNGMWRRSKEQVDTRSADERAGDAYLEKLDRERGVYGLSQEERWTREDAEASAEADRYDVELMRAAEKLADAVLVTVRESQHAEALVDNDIWDDAEWDRISVEYDSPEAETEQYYQWQEQQEEEHFLALDYDDAVAENEHREVHGEAPAYYPSEVARAQVENENRDWEARYEASRPSKVEVEVEVDAERP